MITLSKKNVSVLMIIILFICAGTACASEQKKLIITTYFPAPYGRYKELTTTDNTYLAVNGGGVGIGVGVGSTGPNTLLQVGTSPGPGLFVQTSGNVGMGTTNPSSYKLYVKGDLYVNGSLSYPAGTPPPGAGNGACPASSCDVVVCKDGTCGAGNFCTIRILDGIIIWSDCT